jgi:hypothetical protein
MKNVILLLIGLTMSGCVATVAGNGQAGNGSPITGRYTQSPADPQNFNLDVLIVSSNGSSCVANQNLPYGMTVWTLPLRCNDGRTGSMTLTADYLNARDTVIYRLSNGETGRLVFGASLLVAQQ